MNSRSDLQFKQNSAHDVLGFADVFAALRASCQRLDTHRWTPRPFAFCLVRDPHSCRSVPEKGQPVSFFGLWAESCCNFLIALPVTGRNVASSAIEIKNKGTRTCLRKLGSSQEQQHSHWQDVSNLTLNGRLLVLAQAASPAKFLRTIDASKVHLLVDLSVRCLTNCNFFKTLIVRSTRSPSNDRRRGYPLVAILRLRDPSHV